MVTNLNQIKIESILLQCRKDQKEILNKFNRVDTILELVYGIKLFKNRPSIFEGERLSYYKLGGENCKSHYFLYYKKGKPELN